MMFPYFPIFSCDFPTQNKPLNQTIYNLRLDASEPWAAALRAQAAAPNTGHACRHDQMTDGQQLMMIYSIYIISHIYI